METIETKMEMPIVQITIEQIAKNYASALDSVNLVNELKAKDYWTNEDLTPLKIK